MNTLDVQGNRYMQETWNMTEQLPVHSREKEISPTALLNIWQSTTNSRKKPQNMKQKLLQTTDHALQDSWMSLSELRKKSQLWLIPRVSGDMAPW